MSISERMPIATRINPVNEIHYLCLILVALRGPRPACPQACAGVVMDRFFLQATHSPPVHGSPRILV